MVPCHTETDRLWYDSVPKNQNTNPILMAEEDDSYSSGNKSKTSIYIFFKDCRSSGACCCRSFYLFVQSSIKNCKFPLVSVTTSFVAEEDTIGTASPEANQNDYLETGSSINGETKQLIPERGTDQNAYNSKPVGASFEIVTTNHQKRYIPSASSAMVIGSILGLIQAIFLISAAKPLLNFMGVSSDSPMLKPALQYLMLRIPLC